MTVQSSAKTFGGNTPSQTEMTSDSDELGRPLKNKEREVQKDINFEMQKHHVSSQSASDNIMAADSTDEANSFPEKGTRKPGKLLPCPRCESLDTKFCYFNNYNVNQPRHFCRNCQRYWTAGGSLRNLPVGAGRRKSKYSACRQKHAKATVTSIHLPRGASNDVPHGMPSGGYINFSTTQSEDGSHVGPLSTMSSSSTMLNFDMQSSMGNIATHDYVGVSSNKENSSPIDDRTEAVPGNRTCTEKSSAADSHIIIKAAPDQSVAAEQPHHANCDPVTSSEPVSKELNHKHDAANTTGMGTFQLPYLSPLQYLNCASRNPNHPMPVNPPGGLLPANFMALNNCAPGMWAGFPWPVLPPMWSLFPSAWTMPWNPAVAFAAIAAAGAGVATPQSPHGASETDGSLWIPKTLRIGDPVEAAQSSIWTTLGLVDGPGPLDERKSITTAFDCKVGSKNTDESVTQARQINPAAFSRSMNFNENN